MTSVVPERALRWLDLDLDPEPGTATAPLPIALAGRAVAADTRWLRTLGRRLVLLDAVLVTFSIALALGIVFGPSRRTSIAREWADLAPTSYLVLGPALALAWALFLLVTRTYDGRILGGRRGRVPPRRTAQRVLLGPGRRRVLHDQVPVLAARLRAGVRHRHDGTPARPVGGSQDAAPRAESLRPLVAPRPRGGRARGGRGAGRRAGPRAVRRVEGRRRLHAGG